MDADVFSSLLADIPTGSESEDESESELEVQERIVKNIENENLVVDGSHISEQNSDSDDGYSDEDNIPLSQLQAELNRNKFVWNKTITTYCPPPVFTETVGPCNIALDEETPVDIFLCLFPITLFENIVFQTNLYATQESSKNGRHFIPTNLNEMKTFFAINILMGIKHLPSYRDFWSSRLELRDSYISSLMSRSRFDWLLSHVHLNDNSMLPTRNSPNYDKLYKVRPLLDILSHSFQEFYKPSKEISIDESMILFKGRSSLRQYMPNKPIKRGYKVWVRADEQGYIDQFQIYTGKVGETTEKHLGARVVHDLTRSLINKNYLVFFDNYFTSLPLLRTLKSEGIHACGTIRKGRLGIPQDMKPDKQMVRGEHDWRITHDNISFTKWVDKRIVTIASNYHDPSLGGTVDRKKRNGEIENISCPQVIKDYNKSMGFVDKADMIKSTYEINRKSKKWWHRIMWHFVDVAIVNSFIIYKKRLPNVEYVDLKSFRLSVVCGLVGASKDIPKRGRPSGEKPVSNFKPNVPLERRWDRAAHMPQRGNSRRCALCSTRIEPHRTRWSCSSCEVGLCLNDKKNCFSRYHNKN